jgi:excinuclease UvrABC nuclease subunit
MADTVTWLTHEFVVYAQACTTWHDVAGVYIFCGLTPQRQWRAYYIGQADSFQSRLPGHERWDEAARLGATHVHARVVPQAASRDTVERELIQAYQPPLNVQLR